tara:strand:- start:343 stop:648 length:306 start_codon:yes stop_codon:yes gene_type:complete
LGLVEPLVVILPLVLTVQTQFLELLQVLAVAAVELKTVMVALVDQVVELARAIQLRRLELQIKVSLEVAETATQVAEAVEQELLVRLLRRQLVILTMVVLV